MTLHLVRHAAAGSRALFEGEDDLERPLTPKGAAQAGALVGFFTGTAIREVLSSIAVRCVQTVAPLAVDRGLDVETSWILTEGTHPYHLLDLLRKRASVDADIVLCSHGDLIPEVLSHLLGEGMAVAGPRGCAKGSVWSIAVRDGEIVCAEYVADPAEFTRVRASGP